MTQTVPFHCGDTTALVGYLYGECEPGERFAIQAHLADCPACAAELAALESTRMQLASWMPPEAELGFRIVGAGSPAVGPRDAGAGAPDAGAIPWYRHPLPAWAQLAAAVAIFAAGLSVGVARGTVPAGTPDAERVQASAPAPAPPVTPAVDVAAVEARLRAEMARLTAAPSAPVPAPQAVPDEQFLARVRVLIEESEQRQQRELALRTAQIVRDFDAQRRVDLAQIQRTFGQIEGLTGAEVREQRQMLNYLIRASQQR